MANGFGPGSHKIEGALASAFTVCECMTADQNRRERREPPLSSMT